jgi:hypothetical protein
MFILSVVISLFVIFVLSFELNKCPVGVNPFTLPVSRKLPNTFSLRVGLKISKND